MLFNMIRQVPISYWVNIYIIAFYFEYNLLIQYFFETSVTREL